MLVETLDVLLVCLLLLSLILARELHRCESLKSCDVLACMLISTLIIVGLNLNLCLRSERGLLLVLFLQGSHLGRLHKLMLEQGFLYHGCLLHLLRALALVLGLLRLALMLYGLPTDRALQLAEHFG